MKIAHIADVHIRNYKYQSLYKTIFSRLYESLRENDVDAIYVGGDIAHTKTNISPEYVELTSDFFEKLASIAPTYIIVGNHDLNVSNLTRTDSISPIVNNLKKNDKINDNLFYLKNSQEVEIGNDIVFNHLSIIDKENWIVDPTDPDKINIALYHGAVKGSKTDVGYVFQHGDIDIENFEKFDFAMLGDIHKTNQVLDTEGRARYCGSLIQQNFGETNDKGYLLWDIKNKDDFSCELVEIENPCPFVTVYLDSEGKLPKHLMVPTGCRVRLVSKKKSITSSEMKKHVDVIKEKYKPESVKYLLTSFKDKKFDIEVDEEVDEDITNIRDIKTQEKLIKDFLEPYDLSEDEIAKVLEINKKVDDEIQIDEDVVRNINWNVKKVEWDNLFNYGEGNVLDFENLSGITGIFGPNYSGKSSTIEVILYALYNSTSKNITKNLDLINQNKDKAKAVVTIEMGNYTYKITRESEKYTQRLHGVETLKASTDLEFKRKKNEKGAKWQSLNGNTRWDTDANIRKYFGTKEDFLLTSLSSQFGSLQFLEERSTNRKKILARFLDLNFFERKHDKAKEYSLDLRGAVKFMESKDIPEKIESSQNKLEEIVEEYDQVFIEQQNLKTEMKEIDDSINEVQDKLDDIEIEVIDIDDVNDKLKDCVKRLSELSKDITTKNNTIQTNSENLQDIHSKVSNISIDDINESLEEVEDLNDKIDDLKTKKSKKDDKLQEHKKYKSYIENAPCNNEYSDCKLVEDAKEFLERSNDISKIEDAIDKLDEQIANKEGEVESYDTTNLLKKKKEYMRLLDNISDLESENEKLKLQVKYDQTKLDKVQEEMEDLNSLQEKYKKNKKDIKKKAKYTEELAELDEKCSTKKSKMKEIEKRLTKLTKDKGYHESKIKDLEEDKEEMIEKREEYNMYTYYEKAVHNNGIPFTIIKKNLSTINKQISNILSSFVDFEVFFVDNDNRLDIYLKHPKYEPRLIETCSGSEKSISAMAIRLAIISISSLPKPDLFILDEPGTELDEENMESFQSVLSLIKSFFGNIILISHLDGLKDSADEVIEISKKDGFAHINV